MTLMVKKKGMSESDPVSSQNQHSASFEASPSSHIQFLTSLPPPPWQRARSNLPVSGGSQLCQSLFPTLLTPWQPWPVCPFRMLLWLLTENVDLLFPISQTSDGL